VEPGRDRDRLYALLAELRSRLGDLRLAECDGRMGWPTQGVYFFFEDGELRPDSVTPRVVRVGTHAVSRGSTRTLWDRLSTHRGTARTGGGNHRGSIFRLHVGTALLNRDPQLRASVDSWAKGSSAPRDVREAEHEVERAVSSHIRGMPFLWIRAEDDAGPDSVRAIIERNAIALLNRYPQLRSSVDSWAKESSAPRDVREAEHEVERAVSSHIRGMPFLWIRAEDDAGPDSVRAIIERNAIALLSCSAPESGPTADPPSTGWLGHDCDNEAVRSSGLWNVRHVGERYDSSFLDLLESCVSNTHRNV
jgi:hypothetical protein